jgi:hypothetical protein
MSKFQLRDMSNIRHIPKTPKHQDKPFKNSGLQVGIFNAFPLLDIDILQSREGLK